MSLLHKALEMSEWEVIDSEVPCVMASSEMLSFFLITQEGLGYGNS